MQNISEMRPCVASDIALFRRQFYLENFYASKKTDKVREKIASNNVITDWIIQYVRKKIEKIFQSLAEENFLPGLILGKF